MNFDGIDEYDTDYESIRAPKRLARFRADPEKVRVSVCAVKGGWRVRVGPRDDPNHFVQVVGDAQPEIMIILLLRHAECERLEGVDLDMSWTYRHPQFIERGTGHLDS